MRKEQKKQLFSVVATLYEAHDAIKKYIKIKDIQNAYQLLADCQNTAIELGGIIEQSQGEDCVVIRSLENYCEEVYQISVAINQELDSINANNIAKKLNKSLIEVENSIKQHINVKLEIVFMPYKASMWDSMESVWQAADKDPNCDAYVVPIPYYDRKKDGSLGEYHYEGLMFPEYVPIVSSYDLEKRRPDVIYIHNPYDGGNLVTSVDPKYYSEELKKYTDCLVYIPYFSIRGVMSESKASCLAYYNADYIVTQNDTHTSLFDKNIAREKFLPFGSPKFDRIINICKNTPMPPLDWQLKMQGKKVYFFNTSIAGMLRNTSLFIKKISYIFKCFINHPDACLLWRPHPLLESTFESMRPQYLKEFRVLKQLFIDKNLGIYDETPDADMSLAISDVYIGDSGSSLISVFGVTGKPIFILDNNVNVLPTDDDYVGSATVWLYPDSDMQYIMVQGNQLYYSPNNDFRYEHLSQISKKINDYCFKTLSISDKIYLMPYNVPQIAVYKDGVVEKIKLRDTIYEFDLFYNMLNADKYIILLPRRYPYIVRFNIYTKEVKYFTAGIDVFTQIVGNEYKSGGCCIKNDLLFAASPTDDRVFVMNIKTGKYEVSGLNSPSWKGTAFIACDGDDLWFMPYNGTKVLRYTNNEPIEYDCNVDGLRCINTNGYRCDEIPFYYPAFSGDYVYLSAYWANKCVKINKITGEVSEYITPFDLPNDQKNGYYYSEMKPKCSFVKQIEEDVYLMYSYYNRTVYRVNLKENTYKRFEIKFNKDELLGCETGFNIISMTMPYACRESAFNSLENLLHDNINGQVFNREIQLKAFSSISNNIDGTCGEKLHAHVMNKLLK